MMKLGFYGAAGEVTGSNYVLEGAGTKIMVDCGFFQGVKVCDDKNSKPFLYDPKTVEALFVTHAHLDHVGRIPKLFTDGFRGKIYSTPPTREIAKLMLEDTARIIAREAREDNHPPLYDADHVREAFEHWEAIPYEQDVVLGDGVRVRFRDAGHILGSAMLEVEHQGKKLVFSGDLGNSPGALMHDTALLSGIHYLIMEAVYGSSLHEEHAERIKMLEDVVEDTVKRGGVLMIPAFSIERTQELLFELNDLVEGKKIPEIPVFVDSPLAIKVTKAYSEHQAYFNPSATAAIAGGDDIFKFPKLRFTERAEDSIAIRDVPSPKIIIAGSGMSNGGRILHHERHYLPDPNSTLLLVGYQAVGTMGRAIEEGIKTVTITDEEIPVRAKIVTINGYSAHKDMNALLEFVSNVQDSVKKLFIVHAEPGVASFFSQRVRDYLAIHTHIPKMGEVVEIDF